MSLDDEQIVRLLKSLQESKNSDETRKILSSLTPKQAIALREKFGEASFEIPYTLEDVEKQFDVTRDRIREIEERALRKLGKTPPIREGIQCAFCGKYESEVKIVISWDTGATICNECIELAKGIVDDEE